jgi:16S rRNA (cytidine1402-2'-O)-methyltransferase
MLLEDGKDVAYVSDAGTPGVSDPGSRLAAAVREAGYPVVPLPGASAVTTLVSVAGTAGEVLAVLSARSTLKGEFAVLVGIGRKG